MDKKMIMEANLLKYTIGLNPFIPFEPTKKQMQFLIDFDTELFYGGAAGGGKSVALLLGALMFVDYNDYNALILRRTYPDLALPGALMDLAEKLLKNTPAKYHDKGKYWAFPSGARLSFGYLEHERDKFRYDSSEFDYIAFDELTQFTETQYRYLFSRLRREKTSKIPSRMRSASNPGGLGHEWVKNRFIKSTHFIPARLEDNPYLDHEEYEKSLEKLDLVTYRQKRWGDWDILPSGNMFKRDWFKIVDDYPRNYSYAVRYWDLAATEHKEGTDPDYTVGLLMIEQGGRFWVLDVQRDRLSPRGVENMIKTTAKIDNNKLHDYIIGMEQEGGSGGKNTIDYYSSRVLFGYDFHGIRSTGSKSERARAFSAAMENGNVFIVSGGWNSDYINELIPFPSEGVHDDQVDGSSGAFNLLVQLVGGAPDIRVLS